MLFGGEGGRADGEGKGREWQITAIDGGICHLPRACSSRRHGASAITSTNEGLNRETPFLIIIIIFFFSLSIVVDIHRLGTKWVIVADLGDLPL